jgi:four helix bundle protein
MELKDLKVYRKLFDLHLEANQISLTFPKFETYELGSQVRRSSNSATANLAEGFSNKHTNIYTECISRSQAEIRETLHHMRVALKKEYITPEQFARLETEYQECSKMLYGLEKALMTKPRKPLKSTN